MYQEFLLAHIFTVLTVTVVLEKSALLAGGLEFPS